MNQTATIKRTRTTKKTWTNWAKNVTCKAEIHYPDSEQAIVEILHQAAAEGKTVRVVGEGHSFSPLVQTNDCMVSITKLRGLISVDQAARTATVWAGTPLKVANEALYKEGLAMINLGDIDVQSLAGATATGTHGTGMTFGNLSSEVIAFTLITADGTILDCSPTQNREVFEAGRISLGALGIITKMTFNVVPAYKLEYTSAPGDFEETMQQLDELIAQNRNFEYYHFPYAETLQLKISNVTEAPVKHNRLAAYLNDVLIENSVLQLICKFAKVFPKSHKLISRGMARVVPKGTIVNWSHKVYATVRQVRFKEMEYGIPLADFDACIRQIRAKMEERNYPIFFPLECRFVKGDDCWLSPSYGRDSAYIAVHVPFDGPHETYFEEIEQILMSYQGRPHWGKMHTRTAENLAPAYERWEDFLALRDRLDPEGLFLNDYLRRIFGR